MKISVIRILNNKIIYAKIIKIKQAKKNKLDKIHWILNQDKVINYY